MANAAQQKSAATSKNKHEAESADDPDSPLAALPDFSFTPLFWA
jgi:hypothetical protein